MYTLKKKHNDFLEIYNNEINYVCKYKRKRVSLINLW